MRGPSGNGRPRGASSTQRELAMPSDERANSDPVTDALRKQRGLAEAAVAVLGDVEESLQHHCHRGSWLFIGGLIVAVLMGLVKLGAWEGVGVLFVVGFVANFFESRRVKSQIAAERGNSR